MKLKKELIIPICRRKNPNQLDNWHIGWSSDFDAQEIKTFEQSGSDFIEKQSSQGWKEMDGLLRNKEFVGPFEIIGIFSSLSTAGYSVGIKLPNNEFVNANIKYDTLFDLMEKELVGKTINCSLTFMKRGSSYFLTKYV